MLGIIPGICPYCDQPLDETVGTDSNEIVNGLHAKCDAAMRIEMDGDGLAPLVIEFDDRIEDKPCSGQDLRAYGM